MTDAWKPIATRGELHVEFQSRKLAQAMSQTVAPNCQLIGFVLPDHGPMFAMSFESVETAAAWCREMAPSRIGVFGADDQDERALRDAIVPSKPRMISH